MRYDQIIETQGIKIPLAPSLIVPRTEQLLRYNRYENSECDVLRRTLRSGDRVLELGGGLGLCSTVAARCPGVELVVSVEADAQHVALIKETHKLNGVENSSVLNGTVEATKASNRDFYAKPDPCPSSLVEIEQTNIHKFLSKTHSIHDLIEKLSPTIVVCSVQGIELGMFEQVDLSSVRAIVLKLHPDIYGQEGMARVLGTLASKQMVQSSICSDPSSVQVFERREGLVKPRPNSQMPARRYRPMPTPNPRVMVATCINNEGSNILEWLSWHRAIGATEFVVYSNESSNSTTALLNYLDDLGEIHHIPGAALTSTTGSFHHFAMQYTHNLREFSEADYFISLDVDEFINVRVGEGHLDDLFAATGPFDALSMTELEPQGDPDCRGDKTIVRLSETVKRVRDKRPDFQKAASPVLWLNGSGQYISELENDLGSLNLNHGEASVLVSLERCQLRSIAGRFIKISGENTSIAESNLLRADQPTSHRSQHEYSPNPQQANLAKEYYEEEFQADMVLMALHEECVHADQRTARQLRRNSYSKERRTWIMSEGLQDLPLRPAND